MRNFAGGEARRCQEAQVLQKDKAQKTVAAEAESSKERVARHTGRNLVLLPVDSDFVLWQPWIQDVETKNTLAAMVEMMAKCFIYFYRSFCRHSVSKK